MRQRLQEMPVSIELKNGRKLVAWLGGFGYFSSKKVLVMDNSADRFAIHLFTADHVYGITATSTYLGCTVASRAPRPGEEHTRGSDLPDGDFCWEVFQRIMGAIVCCELEEIVEFIPQSVGEVKEVTT